MVATPSSSAATLKSDPKAVHDFFHTVVHPGDVHEARIVNTRKGPRRFYGTVAGYFDNADDFAAALDGITGLDAAGVYVTMNPVKPALLARGCNRLVDKVKTTASDGDIVHRRHLLIDTDPVRDPADVSATDEEVALAIARRDGIRRYLAEEHGWPEPVVISESGNGGALLYRIDLPNDPEASGLVQRVLLALDALFSDECVKLDIVNYNAARITKVVGTVAAKGDHFVGHSPLPDRPWRLATATYTARPDVVTAAHLTAVAAEAPQAEPAPQQRERSDGAPGQRAWSMAELLRLNGLDVVARSWCGGTKYPLDRCLVSPDHTDGAALLEMPSGAIVYRCHHNRCADKRWADVRSRLKIPSTASSNGRTDGAAHKTTTKSDSCTADAASDTATQPAWPTLDDAALHGLAGDIVRAIEPHTEADPAALLVNVLASFGNAAGPEAYAVAEGRRHRMNIAGVVVGDTSKGRKGSSRSRVEQVFELADVVWVNQHIVSGLSSGEGLIHAVRDPGDRRDKEGELVDAGVVDKRVLVVEEEFCTVLKVMAREGNTLSAIVRQAWDSGNLRVLNKNTPVKATGAHISVIGHATRPELRRDLTDTEAANGFGNRFLWLCSRRSKCLPEGGGTPSWGDLDRRLREALAFARTLKQPITRDHDARGIWAKVYPSLSEGGSGLVGALTSRAEAQVLRLSVIYAVMDRSAVVRPDHLMAALAFWDYTEESTRYIFGTASGNPVADRILSALKDAGSAGMTLTEISGLFSRHTKAGQRQAALEELESAGLAGHKTVETDGRPSVVYYAL